MTPPTLTNPPKYPTLLEAATEYKKSLAAKAPTTAASYRSSLAWFMRYVDAQEACARSMRTNRLPENVLADFYLYLLSPAGPAKKSSAQTYIAGVRSFMRLLDRLHYLSPAISFERMKENARDVIGRKSYNPPTINNNIARVVVHVAQRQLPADTSRQQRLTLLRNKAIIAVLFSTGARRGELVGLNRDSIVEGEAHIIGKGMKARSLFFDDASLHSIAAYLAERDDVCPALFVRHDDGARRPDRLSAQSIWAIVRKYGAEVGVHAHPHEMRHLFARTLLRNQAPLGEVSELMGHASPSTTKMVYGQYDRQHLKNSHKKFSMPAQDILA